jgi:hypothetical protein
VAVENQINLAVCQVGTMESVSELGAVFEIENVVSPYLGLHRDHL